MMRLKNFYLLALLLTLVSGSLTAQSSKLERAKRYMKELNYQGAIELLQAVLAKNDNAEAKINLAECYRKVSDSENGEFMYAQVVRLPEAQPIHYLYYGEMLQRNNKCDLAKEWFQKFTEAVPEDVRGQYMAKACDYEQELKVKGEGIYDVKRATFNSKFDDFGATFYKDGIVFASERDEGISIKRNHSWTGQPFLDLYFVPIKGCGSEVTYGRVEKFANEINTKYHDAVVTFTKDRSTMYFTRNNYIKGKAAVDDEGVMKLKVYSAKKSGKDNWGNEEALPFNSDEYSCAHPSLSEDGTKLYFASDMPGGFGGMDIYVSELEGGRWGPPVNLGPSVNTEGHELFPFIHKTGRLYFASDGHLGLGGMDIIYVDEKGNGQWSLPENPGAPINSPEDDFCISLNDEGTCGFFSSDRTGGSGRDDIYSFTKMAIPVKVLVYDADTKEPLEGAFVKADLINKILKTGKDGYVIVEMRFNTCKDFTAEFEGYEKNTKQGCVRDATTNETTIIEIPLSKQLKFSVDGVVFDDASGLPLPDAKVTLIGCEGLKSSVLYTTTDASGRYSFPLEKGCCYKIKGEKEKYFAVTTPDTICTKDLREDKNYQVNLRLQPTVTQPTEPDQPISRDNTPKTKPQQPTDPKRNVIAYDPNSGKYMDKKTGKPADGTIDGTKYKKGQKVTDDHTFKPSPQMYPDSGVAYLLHIYYDFDQSFIRDESTAELKKLEKMLKDNPTYIIEISSHTDARGSNTYNNRLSQRRAEAVVRWLIDQGIERDRLVPRGYGETLSTNKCINNIPCTEKEHQMNRRTEFRVLGCKDCAEKDKIKSKPNANARVDKCHGCPF